VAIIGSNPSAVFGRELLLGSQPDLKVVFLGSSLEGSLQPLISLTFDALLLDKVLGDSTASSVIRDLGALLLAVDQEIPPIVVTAPFHSKRLEVDLIDAGATSLLSLEQPAEDLLHGLRISPEERFNFDLPDLLESFEDSGAESLADSSFLGAIYDLDEEGKAVIANLKAQALNTPLSSSSALSASKLKRGVRDLVLKFGLHTSKQFIYRLWKAGELG
jgi:hypothetical protein